MIDNNIIKNYNNLKLEWKIFFIGFIILFLLNVIFLRANNNLIIMNIIILIIIIFIITLDYFSDFSYNYDIYDPIVYVGNENNININISYEIDFSFYIKQKSNNYQELFHATQVDSIGTNIYNPLVYIAPNTSDLIIEVRNKDYSSILYDIYTSKAVNIEGVKNTIDICLNNCSEDSECKGVYYSNDTTCQYSLEDNSSTEEDNITNNDYTNNIYYYRKNKYDEDTYNDYLIGSKLNYNNVCIVKNLPLTSIINVNLKYDNNNLYIQVSYDGETINKICNLSSLNSLYSSNNNPSFNIDKSKDSAYIQMTKFNIS